MHLTSWYRSGDYVNWRRFNKDLLQMSPLEASVDPRLSCTVYHDVALYSLLIKVEFTR